MPPLSNFQKSCVALAIGQALAIQDAAAAEINVDGTCTLRDAIFSANGDATPAGSSCEPGVGPDIINIPAETYSYDDPVDSYYGIGSMLPTISSYITLQGDAGGGTVIERLAGGADPDFRLLAVASASSLTLQSITLQNGRADYGGAIYAYDASVTIHDSVIDGNTATTAGAGIFLQCSGDVSITDSTLSNNNAAGWGGGIVTYYSDIYCDVPADLTVTIEGSEVLNNTAVANEGAGIYISTGALQITDTNVQGNQAESGAAIYSDYSTVALDSVTLQSNIANGNGGGIYMVDSVLTVTESQITNNSSNSGVGGAIFSAYTAGSNSKVYFDRSTVSGNAAMIGAGAYIAVGDLEIDKSTFSSNNATVRAGALYHAGDSLVMQNSTISGNVAPMTSALGLRSNAAEIFSSTIYGNSIAGGGDEMSDPAVILYTATTNVHNTIIAGNSGVNCGGDYAGSIPQANHNWFDDTSCDWVTQGSPMLNSLSNNNNGLPNSTFTHLPKPTSGVLDAGDPAFCTDAILGPGPFDQRGAPRNTNICDIGAVEREEEDDACFVVKAANGKVLTFCL